VRETIPSRNCEEYISMLNSVLNKGEKNSKSYSIAGGTDYSFVSIRAYFRGSKVSDPIDWSNTTNAGKAIDLAA
jgi:hypothetical protein